MTWPQDNYNHPDHVNLVIHSKKYHHHPKQMSSSPSKHKWNNDMGKVTLIKRPNLRASYLSMQDSCPGHTLKTRLRGYGTTFPRPPRLQEPLRHSPIPLQSVPCHHLPRVLSPFSFPTFLRPLLRAARATRRSNAAGRCSSLRPLSERIWQGASRVSARNCKTYGDTSNHFSKMAKQAKPARSRGVEYFARCGRAQRTVALEWRAVGLIRALCRLHWEPKKGSCCWRWES